MKINIVYLMSALLVSNGFAQTNVDPYKKGETQSRIAYDNAKLEKMVFPSIAMEESSLEVVLDFLAYRSRQLDKTGKGLRFTLRKDLREDLKSSPEDYKVTMELEDVTLESVLYLLCQNLDISCTVNQHGIVLHLPEEKKSK